MRLLLLMPLFSTSLTLIAQPANDHCENALVWPVFNNFNSPFLFEGSNAGATPQYPLSYVDYSSDGGVFSGLGADVWYSFQAATNACVSISVQGLAYPEINLIEGGDCTGGYELGTPLSVLNEAVLNDVEISANTTYLLRVSGSTQDDQGDFVINIYPTDCPEDIVISTTGNYCHKNDQVTFNPLPGPGNTYPAGEQVEICYNLLDFENSTGPNQWLHGVEIIHSQAWNNNPLEYELPYSCSFTGSGHWEWYDYWESQNSGFSFGPGFAYDSPIGGPYDGDPGNNWGDECHPNAYQSFCWTMQLEDCASLNGISGASVIINALDDGLSGSWNNITCDYSVDEIIELNIICEDCLRITGETIATPTTCSGDTDGALTVTSPYDDLGVFDIGIYDLNDVLLYSYAEVTLPFTTPNILAEGTYGIIATAPWASDPDIYCEDHFIDIAVIEVTESSIEVVADCDGNAATLNINAGFPLVNPVYNWSGPNGYSSTDAEPTVTESGWYYGNVNNPGTNCSGQDSVLVTITPPIEIEFEITTEIICSAGSAELSIDGNQPIAGVYWPEQEIGGNTLMLTSLPLDETITVPVVVYYNDSLCVATDTATLSIASPASIATTANEACVGEVVTLIGLLPSGVFYEWNTGDVGGVIDVFSTQAGVQTYSVTITDVDGCSYEANRDITFVAPPDFTLEIIELSPLTYQFSPNGTFLAGDTFLWNFGDGSTSEDFSAVHTYPAPGSYNASFTVNNACGSFTVEEMIVTVQPVQAAFTTTGVTQGCGPLAVQYNDESENASSLNWSFPGGSPATATGSNPLVSYTSSGTYSVQLIANNALGSDTTFMENSVEVFPLPTADITFTTNALTSDFNANANDADTYSWDFGDGFNSTDANPTHTYALSGEYNISLTVTNDCGSVTVTDVINFTAPPTVIFSAQPESGCGPLSVQYTNQSTNATSFAWSFPGGIPSTSTEQSPVVIYENPGLYSASLTAFNAVGDASSNAADLIEVLPLALADFSLAINGLNVSFTNLSQNGNSYLWDFGDGNSSTAFAPLHTYANGGVYTVTLTTSNSCGSVSSSQEIDFGPAPTAAFTTLNETTACLPHTVSFANQSLAAQSYQWAFPGGTPSISNIEDPQATYTQAGTYDVQLMVSNSIGNDTLLLTDYITIIDEPLATFAASINGAIVSLSGNINNADSYIWDFGDGTTNSTSENPVYSYTASGTYTITLSATNSCGTVSYEQSIEVLLPPVSDFSPNFSVNICAPQDIPFTNLSTDATSYQWLFPGGQPSNSTQLAPVVTYSQAGSYDVTLITTNANGSDTLTRTAIIVASELPSAMFTTDISTLTLVLAALEQGNNYSYSWDFGDGNTSTEASPVYTYATGGAYTVSLTVTNECGSFTTQQQIDLGLPPVADYTIEGEREGCPQLLVQYLGNSPNADTYIWTFPGGEPATSTEPNPLVSYDFSGFYDVQLVVSNALGSDTLVVTEQVEIIPLPEATITFAGNGLGVQFSSNAPNETGTDTYQWYFGDGGQSQLANPRYFYGSGGTYTVTLVVENQCGIIVETVTINVEEGTIPGPAFPSFAGIPQRADVTEKQSTLNQLTTWYCYPNPNQGQFFLSVKGTESHTNGQLILLNTLGQVVYAQSLELQNAEQIFAVSPGLPAGVYLSTLVVDEKILGYQKMVIE